MKVLVGVVNYDSENKHILNSKCVLMLYDTITKSVSTKSPSEIVAYSNRLKNIAGIDMKYVRDRGVILYNEVSKFVVTNVNSLSTLYTVIGGRGSNCIIVSGTGQRYEIDKETIIDMFQREKVRFTNVGFNGKDKIDIWKLK